MCVAFELTFPQWVNMQSRIIEPTKSPTAAHPNGRNKFPTFPPKFSAIESVRVCSTKHNLSKS